MFSSFFKHKKTQYNRTLTNQRGTHVYYQARYDNMICDISTEKYTQTNIFSPSDTDGRSDL